jgi:hypothetical protein
LFALGIMGEYLARMHMRTMNRPSYAVRTVSESPLERIDNRMATKNAIDNF